MPRRPLDFYQTPPHYLAALFGEVALWGTVYEPCAGDGAITTALQQLPSVRRVWTNDIDYRLPADFHEDATFAAPDGLPKVDWVVTNPPFSQELEILDRAFDLTPNVAFLARISFLEPAEDREFLLEQQPPKRVIYLPRYSFRLNDDGKRQTDSVTCCWMVWGTNVEPGIAVWGRGKAHAHALMRDL